MGARRESLKTGSVIRSRTSYQQLDSESDKEKQPLFAILGRPYTISWIMATSIGLVAVVLTGFIALPSTAVAWTIPRHMVSGSITF